MGQQLFAFAPSGSSAVTAGQNTTNLTVSAAAQNLVLPFLASDDNTVMLTNIGTLPSFFLIGAGLAVTVSNGVPLLPNQQREFTIAPGVTALSVIGTGAGSVLYATAGKGI